jgi:hypothetical protein
VNRIWREIRELATACQIAGTYGAGANYDDLRQTKKGVPKAQKRRPRSGSIVDRQSRPLAQGTCPTQIRR